MRSPSRIARVSRIHLSFFMTFFLLIGVYAEARLAEPADLPAVNELERAQFDIDAHGHSTVTVERMIRVNNDEGRERESLQSIDFNSRAATLKILLAETINSKSKTQVEKKNIEIKPIGDFSRYFDTQKKAKITFPDVQIGSKIHLKYQIHTTEVPSEGFWSLLADFNWWYMEDYEASIRSVLPLYHWKNDPNNLLDIKSTKDDKFFKIEVRSLGPIQLQTVQEENPFIASDRSTGFVISTQDKWANYARPTIVAQEKLFVEDLPPTMKVIRDEAAHEKNIVAQLDRVASLISTHFRYFGDWRRRNGGFLPRPLKEIEETRYGDCKDLSLVATAIFRSLGLKADLAWTLRGDAYLKPSHGWYGLPVDWFNHAVTRVEVGSKVYWIDATNPVSYAGGIPQDISGKPAFVLRPDQAFLEFIPNLTAESYRVERELTYAYQPDHSLKVSGKVKLAGRAAVGTTASVFYKPISTVNYELIHVLSAGYKILDSWVGDFKTGSRIVTDFDIPIKFTLADIGVRTSAGYGFILSRENAVDHFLEETKDRASDIYAGDAPGVWISNEAITGVKKVGKRMLDCDIKSEWLNASRRIVDTPRAVIVLKSKRVLYRMRFCSRSSLENSKPGSESVFSERR